MNARKKVIGWVVVLVVVIAVVFGGILFQKYVGFTDKITGSVKVYNLKEECKGEDISLTCYEAGKEVAAKLKASDKLSFSTKGNKYGEYRFAFDVSSLGLEVDCQKLETIQVNYLKTNNWMNTNLEIQIQADEEASLFAKVILTEQDDQKRDVTDEQVYTIDTITDGVVSIDLGMR